MKEIIGYQIVTKDMMDIPEGFYSFQVIEDIKDVIKWFSENKDSDKYMILPIFDGDVEDPTFI